MRDATDSEFDQNSEFVPDLFRRRVLYLRPGEEIVPSKVNSPTPTVGPVKSAEPLTVPLPVAPEKRPVPPMTV